MDDEIANARAAVLATAFRMRQIFIFLLNETNAGREIPMAASLFIGASMVAIARYCKATTDVIDNPTVQQPVMGRRCMFY